jgi:hypothetical protein
VTGVVDGISTSNILASLAQAAEATPCIRRIPATTSDPEPGLRRAG